MLRHHRGGSSPQLGAPSLAETLQAGVGVLGFRRLTACDLKSGSSRELSKRATCCLTQLALLPLAATCRSLVGGDFA